MRVPVRLSKNMEEIYSENKNRILSRSFSPSSVVEMLKAQIAAVMMLSKYPAGWHLKERGAAQIFLEQTSSNNPKCLDSLKKISEIVVLWDDLRIFDLSRAEDDFFCEYKILFQTQNTEVSQQYRAKYRIKGKSYALIDQEFVDKEEKLLQTPWEAPVAKL